jgi:twitching motility protein PilT
LTLQGVVSQLLLPTADGKRRVVACEVLVITQAVRNLIREHHVHMLYAVMQAGRRFGMQTMDASLAELVRAGSIAPEVAFDHCHDHAELTRLIGG